MTDELLNAVETQLPDPNKTDQEEVCFKMGGYEIWYMIQERDGKREWQFWSGAEL